MRIDRASNLLRDQCNCFVPRCTTKLAAAFCACAHKRGHYPFWRIHAQRMMLYLLAYPTVGKHVARGINGRGVNVDNAAHLYRHLQ